MEPDFDGRFPTVQAPLTAKDADTPRRKTPIPLPIALPGMASVPGAAATVMALDAGQVVQNVGRPQTEHLDHAGRIVGGLPPALLAAAREPFSAQAVIFSLLLNRGKGVGSLLPEGPEGCSAQKTPDPFSFRQLQVLQGAIPPALFQEVQQLAGLTQSLPAASRLPLVNLTVPALGKASPQQYVEFRRVVEALVAAEHRVGLFEYCLRIVLFSYLDVHFRLKKPPAIRYRTVASVSQPLDVILSTLAYAGQSDMEGAERVFQAEAEKLAADGAAGAVAELLPQAQCTLAAFDAALRQLAQGDATLKRRVIAAAAACIATDGKVTLEEDELLRAVAAALACPLPLRAGQPPA